MRALVVAAKAGRTPSSLAALAGHTGGRRDRVTKNPPSERGPFRARCEDRIRCAKDTGLRNLPLHDFAGNQLWCAIVGTGPRAHRLDADAGPARPPGPPLGTQTTPTPAALDHRQVGRHRRCTVLHLSRHAPCAQLLTAAITTLRLLPAPG
jgi:hypothetical protein